MNVSLRLRRFGLALALVVGGQAFVWPSAATAQADAEVPAATPAPAAAPRITDLLNGRCRYAIMESGANAGTTVVEAGFGAGTYFIRDVSAMGSAVQEEALLRLDADTLAPLSSDVTGTFGDTEVRTHQSFGDQRVTGYVLSRRGPGEPWHQSGVDVEVPGGATWRGALIWTAQARGLAPGTSVRVPWYSTLARAVEEVTFTATGRATVTVPAGTFEAVRIEQTGGTPENVIYVTATAPFRIVRIEVVGQPLTIDLTHYEPRFGHEES